MSDSESWLDGARQYAENGRRLTGFDNHEAMVQYEQAAEYALKAAQIGQTGSFRSTHDVVGLGHEIGVPDRFLPVLSDLYQAYSRRYPDDPNFDEITSTDPTTYRSDVEDLIDWAEKECMDAKNEE